MPPKLLMDISKLDIENIIAGPEQIRTYNPQRYEFEQLDGIIHFDPEENIVVGVKDVKNDEFWVKGHIPGRPLFPGVLMCESAAQLCSYYFKRVTETDKFLGFGGLDDVKFRGQVLPGTRLVIIAKNIELGRRRALFECQGIIENEKIVFQGVINGMPM